MSVCWLNLVRSCYALKLDVSEDDIDMTMAYFTKCGLIQIDEDKNAEKISVCVLVKSSSFMLCPRLIVLDKFRLFRLFHIQEVVFGLCHFFNIFSHGMPLAL